TRAFSQLLASVTEKLKTSSPRIQAFHGELLTREDGGAVVRRLADLHTVVARLEELLRGLIDGLDAFRGWQELRDEIDLIAESLDDFPEYKPILETLVDLPRAVAATWQRQPWTAAEMEAAVVCHTAEELLRADPLVAKSTARMLDRRAVGVTAVHNRWRAANAEVIRDRMRRRFLENVRLSSLPHAQLTPEQKEWKPRYNRG